MNMVSVQHNTHVPIDQSEAVSVDTGRRRFVLRACKMSVERVANITRVAASNLNFLASSLRSLNNRYLATALEFSKILQQSEHSD